MYQEPYLQSVFLQKASEPYHTSNTSPVWPLPVALTVPALASICGQYLVSWLPELLRSRGEMERYISRTNLYNRCSYWFPGCRLWGARLGLQNNILLPVDMTLHWVKQRCHKASPPPLHLASGGFCCTPPPPPYTEAGLYLLMSWAVG